MVDLDLPMVARFERKRWSQERIDIHDMKVGDELLFEGGKEYLRSTVNRLNEAYELTREWTMQLIESDAYIVRLK